MKLTKEFKSTLFYRLNLHYLSHYISILLIRWYGSWAESKIVLFSFDFFWRFSYLTYVEIEQVRVKESPAGLDNMVRVSAGARSKRKATVKLRKKRNFTFYTWSHDSICSGNDKVHPIIPQGRGEVGNNQGPYRWTVVKAFNVGPLT